jgi:prepilin-type N-terminal cleavage/methylation domain-containing protein
MKLKAAANAGATARSAFTLIELLVVIAIIVILAGLLLQIAGYVQEKAGRSRAETEIASISSALEAYKLESGSYPTPLSQGDDTSTKILIQELALNPINTPADYNYRKPFEFPIKMLSAYKPGSSPPQVYKDVLEKSDSLVDPFGNPYHYEFKADPAWDNDNRSGKGFFNLWSQGKKNSTNEKLWIKNW